MEAKDSMIQIFMRNFNKRYFFESKSNYSQYGFISNINTLIKNVNVDANNSGKYKDKFDQSFNYFSI